MSGDSSKKFRRIKTIDTPGTASIAKVISSELCVAVRSRLKLRPHCCRDLSRVWWTDELINDSQKASVKYSVSVQRAKYVIVSIDVLGWPILCVIIPGVYRKAVQQTLALCQCPEIVKKQWRQLLVICIVADGPMDLGFLGNGERRLQA